MIVCKKTIVAQDRPLCGDSNNCGVAQVGILDLVFKCSTRGTACAKVQPRGQTTLPGKIKGKFCSFATTIGLKSISLELCLVQ